MEITFFQLLVNIKLIITIIHLMIMMIKMVATIRRVFKGFQQLPFNARSSVSISPSPPLLFCQPLELHALLSRKKAAAEIRKKREGRGEGNSRSTSRGNREMKTLSWSVAACLSVARTQKKAGGEGRGGEGAWVGERGRRWDAPVHRLANKEHDPARASGTRSAAVPWKIFLSRAWNDGFLSKYSGKNSRLYE